tara:strand:+ start:912 stop:1250 length:339 start_codon:yes stop_codon:yes gene_type:complete
MSCDHNTITDLDLGEDKYVLVYCNDKFIFADFVVNKVTTAHTVEVYDTAQEIIDRGRDLGLADQVDLETLIKAMEHGATLSDDALNALLSVVWQLDMSYGIRMEALGFTRPE